MGKVPIFVRVTVNGERAEISVQRKIEAERWNSNAGKVNGTKQGVLMINAYLETIRNKLYNHHKELVDYDRKVSARRIKEEYLGIALQSKKILEIFGNHNQTVEELVGIDYAPATLKRFKTTYKHVQEFIAYRFQAEDVPLKELNYAFIMEFEHYLKTVRSCNHNSTQKYIRIFRKIINIALKNDWLDKDPFARYQGKLERVEREFLSQEELLRLEDHEFNLPRLDEIRDIFVFACYTGLAYVDVLNLSPDQIFIDNDDSKWIRIKRTKTGVPSNIPLLTKAETIIKNYAVHPVRIIQNRLLPVRSNQKTNAYLKEIATICGINKELTFHIARHTFATTVTLNNGVPIESVSSMLGHRKISTTQIYARILQRKVKEDMRELEEKLGNTTSG